MKDISERDQLVIETCLLAGKIMIENGSEMSRVTDTIDRISKNAHVEQARSYVTLTGIIMSAGPKVGSQVIAIERRGFDLEKISVVNDYSRKYGAGLITLHQFYNRLKHINEHVKTFPFWMQVFGAALVSGPLEIVFRGNLIDFWITCLIGIVGYIAYYAIDKYLNVQFISEFIAALLIGIFSILSVWFNLGTNIDDIIIGSIMPLVPGVPITNAVRDVLSGNLVSGPARGIEALMSACALGIGVAVAIKLL
ncbi:membrane protein [Philodulcilactobacillus myokoensis]|uniref:Membrane protein n=1 Tax=Philodulcilactobacillus myokoensis TaxID=2929573 RepID=A0A9W6B0N1_9LACO|nr:threonine/serine exporter family protein [Philodulcilactobacillus myokoensis]GLB46586.1 membrane protein [Philodulcilactobacillus myokoensis]